MEVPPKTEPKADPLKNMEFRKLGRQVGRDPKGRPTRPTIVFLLMNRMTYNFEGRPTSTPKSS